jgi:hypothetical protein
MDHDIYWLFNRYWWLIFPIFGMIVGLLRVNQSHHHNNRVLDMMKSYADQGKEPPAELLAMLRDPSLGGRTQPNWIPVFLFAGLTAGFVLFALVMTDRDFEAMVPFLFVALVMGAMAIGSLINVLRLEKRDRNAPQ